MDKGMLTFEDKFFKRERHEEDEERACAYAVIRDQNGKFAFVEVRGNLFLLGGGIEAGESPEQAIIREALEEAGASISITGRIGEAADIIFGLKEQKWIRKTAVFYEAELQSLEDAGSETDHKLTWLTLEEARPKARQESHIWAIEQVLGK